MNIRKILSLGFAIVLLAACNSVSKKNVVVSQTTAPVDVSIVSAVPVSATAVAAIEEPAMPASLNGNPTGIEASNFSKVADSVISWFGFQEGMEKAIKEKKILLVDSYTDWCYWCKVMDRETYSKKEIIKYINEHFVAVKFNMENDGVFTVLGKKMSNVELYYWLANGNQTGFPTTMFWVNPGVEEYRPFNSGYYKADEFMKVLEGVKKQKK